MSRFVGALPVTAMTEFLSDLVLLRKASKSNQTDDIFSLVIPGIDIENKEVMELVQSKKGSKEILKALY